MRGDAAAAGGGGAGAREALRRHAHLRARMLAHGGATAQSEELTTAPMHALTHATPCSQASTLKRHLHIPVSKGLIDDPSHLPSLPIIMRMIDSVCWWLTLNLVDQLCFQIPRLNARFK